MGDTLHRHVQDVRFGDCDPAGIVYFPRYFDWFHQAMETWFGDALGLPYAEVLGLGVGFPAVHTEADYKAPTRMGERLAIELRVTRVGRSSIELSYRVLGPDETLRATGRTVVAVVGLDGGPQHLQPVPIPDLLRERIAGWLG